MSVVSLPTGGSADVVGLPTGGSAVIVGGAVWVTRRTLVVWLSRGVPGGEVWCGSRSCGDCVAGGQAFARQAMMACHRPMATLHWVLRGGAPASLVALGHIADLLPLPSVVADGPWLARRRCVPVVSLGGRVMLTLLSLLQ